MNKRRAEGAPSIRFTPPVRKIIEGTASLKSVNEIALSLIRNATREDIAAETVNFSSPDNCANVKALEVGSFHDIMF